MISAARAGALRDRIDWWACSPPFIGLLLGCFAAACLALGHHFAPDPPTPVAQAPAAPALAEKQRRAAELCITWSVPDCQRGAAWTCMPSVLVRADEPRVAYVSSACGHCGAPMAIVTSRSPW